MTRKPPHGVCRWCGCTERRPCAAGCHWIDVLHTRCSACLDTTITDCTVEDPLCRLVIDVPALIERLDVGELDFDALTGLQAALIQGMAVGVWCEFTERLES